MANGIGGSTIEAELAAIQAPGGRPKITPEERQARLERARELMGEIGADALLIGAGASLRYFTGVGWGAPSGWWPCCCRALASR